MPGTVATIVAGVPTVCLLARIPLAWAYASTAILFYLACGVSSRAAMRLNVEDPREVVIDELLGFWVTMIGFSVSWDSLLGGFVAFRLFDIWKPWPVNVLDKELSGGLGIVMDDIAAGIYAHVLLWFFLGLLH